MIPPKNLIPFRGATTMPLSMLKPGGGLTRRCCNGESGGARFGCLTVGVAHMQVAPNAKATASALTDSGIVKFVMAIPFPVNQLGQYIT